VLLHRGRPQDFHDKKDLAALRKNLSAKEWRSTAVVFEITDARYAALRQELLTTA
jgi:hypothetical protein